MLLDFAVEHTACSRAVNIAVVRKGIQHPLFSGKPCQNTAFYRRKVRYNKLESRTGNKGGSDKLRQQIRHIAIQHLSILITAVFDCIPCDC